MGRGPPLNKTDEDDSFPRKAGSQGMGGLAAEYSNAGWRRRIVRAGTVPFGRRDSAQETFEVSGRPAAVGSRQQRWRARQTQLRFSVVKLRLSAFF